MQSPVRLSRQHAGVAAWIGIARVDITPPVGIYARNWGAALHDVAESIHRPLQLTVMTLVQQLDGEPLVLIDADLGWWKTPQVFASVQRRLLEAADLEPAQLIFALTHTHAGPPLMEPDESLPGADKIGPWMEQVVASAIGAIREARQQAVAAVLEWHVGRCGLAAYRDLDDPAAPGRRLICGYNPAGQPDDTLLLGRVTTRDGRLLATLVNYACHPTTLAWDNRAISPDFIGAMRETMQRQTGVPALFLQGASGELGPRYQYVGNTSVADQHGQQLAFAALATLEDMQPPAERLVYTGTVESGAPLAVWQHQPRDLPRQLRAHTGVVSLPLKDWPTAAELEQQRAATGDRALEERLRRKRDIRRALGDGAEYDLSIWVWRLGEAVLIGTCCEAYSCWQQELRRRFPDLTVICMNLINGSIGYLPPQSLYAQDLYQVWQTPFDRGSLERLTEVSAELIALSLTADPRRLEPV